MTACLKSGLRRIEPVDPVSLHGVNAAHRVRPGGRGIAGIGNAGVQLILQEAKGWSGSAITSEPTPL